MQVRFPSPLRHLFCLGYELILLSPWLFLVGVVGYSFSMPRAITFLFLIFSVSCYYLYRWIKTGQTLAMKPWGLKLTSSSHWRYVSRLCLGWLFFLGLPIGQYALLRDSSLPIPTRFLFSTLWIFWPFVYSCLDREHQLLHDRLSGTRIYRISDQKPSRTFKT